MTNYHRTAAWLAACGKTPDTPNAGSVQIGCMLEEIREFIEALEFNNGNARYAASDMLAHLDDLAGLLKTGQAIAFIPFTNRVQALDALCDIEIAANGVACLHGFDKPAADQAVLASNDAKLVDGQPVILPGGKIGNPEGWRPPGLTSFV